MKGVIFDFNGTLFFDNPKHVMAWSKISEMIRGRGISSEELHTKCNGVTNKKIIEYLFNGSCTQREAEAYSQMKEKLYREYCQADTETFHLVKGAEAYFNALKEKGIPFTIASASIKENIDFFVKSFHLDQWINPEMIVYDDGSYEDKVAMYQQAAKNIAVPLKDCMIFEDAIIGIQCAYTAGCRNIVIVDSSGKANELRHLPGVVNEIQDFEHLV